MNTITLNARFLVRVLAAAAVLLIIASIMGQIATYASGLERMPRLARLFYLDQERNIPTAFSTLLMLLAVLLLAVTAVLDRDRSQTRSSYWAFLACGFAFMATDEAWSLHERLIRPVRAWLGADIPGIFYYAWVVPAIALVAILTPFIARFLDRLPAVTRRRFVLAAIIYLGGAIGVEMIEGQLDPLHYLARQQGIVDTHQLALTMLTVIEESLEMAGLIVFLRALLGYLESNFGEVRLRITAAPIAGANASPEFNVDQAASSRSKPPR